jgi:hypothetical protein
MRTIRMNARDKERRAPFRFYRLPLLLILTESAKASPHVLREIELAFNARIPILPVRLSGVLPSSDLAYFLSTTQWLDAGQVLTRLI